MGLRTCGSSTFWSQSTLLCVLIKHKLNLHCTCGQSMQFFILLGSFMQYMMSMELPQEKNLCMCVSEFSFS
jgi:hypothetical protein